MARFRRFETRTWTDSVFRDELSKAPPSGQTLWLYLLTGPRTTMFPGLIVAGRATLAEDLGWSPEALGEAFLEIESKGLAEADWKAGVVVLRKALLDGCGAPRDTARPESPNVLRSWAKSWIEIPECALKNDYLATLEAFAQALGKGYPKAFKEAFAKAWGKGPPKGTPIQETGDRRQETGDRRIPQTPAGGSSDTPGSPPALILIPSEPRPDPGRELADAAVAEINRITGRAFKADSDETTKSCAALAKAGVTVADVREVVVAKSAEWILDDRMVKQITPATLLRPSNFRRYLEDLRAGPAPVARSSSFHSQEKIRVIPDF